MAQIDKFEMAALACGIRNFERRFNLTVVQCKNELMMGKQNYYRIQRGQGCTPRTAQLCWVTMANNMQERLKFDPATEFSAARARLAAAWRRSR
jgi:hypothetical protein